MMEQWRKNERSDLVKRSVEHAQRMQDFRLAETQRRIGQREALEWMLKIVTEQAQGNMSFVEYEIRHRLEVFFACEDEPPADATAR